MTFSMTGAISQDWESCQFPFVLDGKPTVVAGGAASAGCTRLRSERRTVNKPDVMTYPHQSTQRLPSLPATKRWGRWGAVGVSITVTASIKLWMFALGGLLRLLQFHAEPVDQ